MNQEKIDEIKAYMMEPENKFKSLKETKRKHI